MLQTYNPDALTCLANLSSDEVFTSPGIANYAILRWSQIEDRYVSYLWNSVHLVQDIDDKRTAGCGVYYTQKKPLTAAALEWRKQKARDIGLRRP